MVHASVGAQFEVVNIVPRWQRPGLQLRIFVYDGLAEIRNCVYVVDDLDCQPDETKSLRGVLEGGEALVRELHRTKEPGLRVAQRLELLRLEIESKQIRGTCHVGRTQEITPVRREGEAIRRVELEVVQLFVGRLPGK